MCNSFLLPSSKKILSTSTSSLSSVPYNPSSRIKEMGITSSNSRNAQIPSEKPGGSSPAVDPSIDWRRDRVRYFAELCMKELFAVFPPTVEGETEREKELEVRFFDFIKGGDCKESFQAMDDCFKEAGSINKCREHLSKMMECVYAHPHYYHPIISVLNSAEDQAFKNLDALAAENQD